VESFPLSADSDLLFDSSANASTTFALAHGAGAGMDSLFTDFFAKGLGKEGYRVARFEYPYMASKRATGKQKPPDREPVLISAWRTSWQRERSAVDFLRQLRRGTQSQRIPTADLGVFPADAAVALEWRDRQYC
jgi:predicted alpha/beta-hydrolase family hydrolase